MTKDEIIAELTEALKALYSVTAYPSEYSVEEKLEAEAMSEHVIAKAETAPQPKGIR